ncbi:MAG: putative DNA-binding domain-containing protein [Candidatus Melainabacteria bacterium]|nr:putative DNA-binding domain-containing protein [Candidatus Melainabacteria bacterium]
MSLSPDHTTSAPEELTVIADALDRLFMQPDSSHWLASPANWSVQQKQPRQAPLATIPWEPLQLYQSLLQATHQDTLGRLYPYCKQLLAPHWKTLAEAHRRAYPCDHYALYQAVREFPTFLESHDSTRLLLQTHPYLPDLARFEWLEVAVEQTSSPQKQTTHCLLQTALPEETEDWATLYPLWNETLVLQVLHYRIEQLIRALEQGMNEPASLAEAAYCEEPLWLAVYRDPNSHRARFLMLNTQTAQLIQLGQCGFSLQSGFQCLWQSLQEANNAPPTLSSVQQDGLVWLRQCLQNGLLSGVFQQ